MKILCMSDLHLSSVRPMCRTDEDWVATQQEHLDYVLNYVKEKQIHHMVIAGDIFDTPTVTPVITNMMLKFIFDVRATGCIVHFIAGNHDLPYHATERMESCSFGSLSLIREENGHAFYYCDYGVEPPKDVQDILVLHRFAVPDETYKTPNRECITAEQLARKYPYTKFIICGDNHEAWYKGVQYVDEHGVHKNCFILNCGAFIQRTAAEAKRECGFWVLNTEEHAALRVELQSLSEGKIDTSYLEDIKEREENKEQYEALLAELRDGVENRYDFVALLSEYVTTHKKDMDKTTYNILMETLNYVRSH